MTSYSACADLWLQSDDSEESVVICASGFIGT